MIDQAEQSTRRRGRPIKGGQSVEQVREQFLDATERCLAAHGFAGTTVAAIAREAGYSRPVLYRYFKGRDELFDALVLRTSLAYIADILPRITGLLPDFTAVFTEAMVIVAIEITHNPLMRVLSQRDENSTAATVIMDSPSLIAVITEMYEALFASEFAHIRPGLSPKDAARYAISTAFSLLLGIVPGHDNPDQVRRYVKTFVLPALITDPPAPIQVFG